MSSSALTADSVCFAPRMHRRPWPAIFVARLSDVFTVVLLLPLLPVVGLMWACKLAQPTLVDSSVGAQENRLASSDALSRHL